MSEANTPNAAETGNLCASGHDFQLLKSHHVDSGKDINCFSCKNCGKKKIEVNGKEINMKELNLDEMEKVSGGSWYDWLDVTKVVEKAVEVYDDVVDYIEEEVKEIVHLVENQ